MAKLPGRRPSVSPSVYRLWLSEFEEGARVPELASREGYDPRTVKRYLELARRERDLKEARGAVLREALHDHYRELADFASKLEIKVSRDEPLLLTDREQRLQESLREHMVRSTLWTRLGRWSEIRQRLTRSRQEASDQLVDDARREGPLDIATSGSGEGFWPDSLSGAFLHLMEAAGGDGEASLLDVKITLEPAQGPLIKVVCNGNWVCALADSKKAQEVQPFLLALLTKALRWPRIAEIKEAKDELKKIREEIRDELMTVVLRRVLPGRCKYCPF